MSSTLEMTLRSFGVVFFALGITTSIIGLLAARFGTAHVEALPTAIAAFIIGAVLFGAGTMLARRAR
ncbi:MAG TPA: hypothetical protein VHM24_07735 [Gemmatimonadaceae bacterium]|nr:hypothetical protein [Gemmatimonadaceae bacterium]